MKKKLIAFFMVMLLAAGSLAGCGKGSETADSQTNTVTDTAADITAAADDKKTDEAESKPAEDDKKNPFENFDFSNFDPSKINPEDIPEGMEEFLKEELGQYTDGAMADKEKEQEAAAEAGFVSESISYLAAEQNPSPTPVPEGMSKTVSQKLSFDDDGSFEFSADNSFYKKDVELTVKAPAGWSVRYTLDGSMPTAESQEYTEPLVFEKIDGDFPDCYTLRVCAFDEKGNSSKVAARSYLVSENAEERFSTAVFFVSGNPDDLLNLPDGIFAGKNYNKRGRDYEKMVYVEALDAKGDSLLSQYAGVRIYGGASRTSSVKSMKLFSRKDYDEDNKNFKTNIFATEKLDGSGDIIKKYDKLVLRNCGNDFQFSYIRDELSQTLCKKAGMPVYEAVVPAICYLNGSYYGYYWLHENYCDKYFKEKFGDAAGEFVVVEGNEQKKNDDDDELTQKCVDEYNASYDSFIEKNLTNNAVYNSLCSFMDVENYLDYMAWNITLGNSDWPNNNYKCFRYVAAEGESAGSAFFDGKWRFLPHDMDYAYGLYDQTETQANYNTLKVVLNPNHKRYAPLFAKLMERADCRKYFRDKTMEYLNGVLSEESIVESYKALHAEREKELAYYYRHLKQLAGKGDDSIWSQAGHYAGYEEQIFTFAAKRGEYIIKYMDELLPEI